MTNYQSYGLMWHPAVENFLSDAGYKMGKNLKDVIMTLPTSLKLFQMPFLLLVGFVCLTKYLFWVKPELFPSFYALVLGFLLYYRLLHTHYTFSQWRVPAKKWKGRRRPIFLFHSGQRCPHCPAFVSLSGQMHQAFLFLIGQTRKGIRPLKFSVVRLSCCSDWSDSSSH